MDNMKRRHIWDQIHDNDFPENVKPIGLKWKFHIKSSGKYKDRIVELGCHQIAGVDYKFSNEHVLSEVTIGLMIVYFLHQPRLLINKIIFGRIFSGEILC